ncbi:MAG: Mce-associated rane protein [Pseudonocardiales bacterium]|nr:Mce-associated rane protein [Pseudonocardiales bacterium]
MSSRRTETTPDAEITSDAETASSTEPAPAAESTPIAADSAAADSTASASTAAGPNGAASNGAASNGADSDGAGTGAGTAGQAARPRAKQRIAGARKPGAAGTALADRDVEDGTAGTDLIAPTGAGTTSTPGTAREAGTGSAAAEPVDPAEPAAASADVESDPHPDLTADRKRVRLLTGLAAAAVVLVAAAVLTAVGWRSAATSGPRSNEAFVDSAATAEVVGQVTNDMTTVYSYDYTNLPANEAAANAVITGKFATEFPRVFGPVKQLAPQEQAVLKSTVPAAGVILLQGDRARLLMMIDQTGTRGAAKEATGATARLVVDAQKVDGRWKISEVTPE